MKLRERMARAWFDWKIKPVVPLDAKQMKAEINGLAFGMRCMMAQGGYKVKPFGMTDKDCKDRGDETAAFVTNLNLMVRCAEDVIKRHGLTDEYRGQLRNLELELDSMWKTEQEKAVAEQVRLKVVHDGNKPDVQETGGNGHGPVDQGSVQAGRGEIAKEG